MTRNEFIEKYENEIQECKSIRSKFRDICFESKKNSKEYRDADRAARHNSHSISLYERMLEDFKSIEE